jgi:hypothetical protein
MAEDFALLEGPAEGLYSLTDPTTDPLERIRSRFVVQFLSREVSPRGSVFVTEVLAGRVKTNSDVVGLFAVTAGRIIDDMRTLALDIAPARAQLDSFEFLDSNRRIKLNFTVVTELGSVTETLTVGEA